MLRLIDYRLGEIVRALEPTSWDKAIAIGTIASALAAAVATWFAKRSIDEVENGQKDQFMPILFFQKSEVCIPDVDKRFILKSTIANAGKGVAKNLKAFVSEREIEIIDNGTVQDIKHVAFPIKLENEEIGKTVSVRIEYKDVYDRDFYTEGELIDQEGARTIHRENWKFERKK